jgi:hypothetical protein
MKTIPSLILACALAACSGGGGSSGVDSGLPADKTGNALTPTEETTLCEARADHLASVVTVEDAHNFACVAAGMTAAAQGNGSVESCQIVYDMCIKMDPKPSSDPAACMLAFELSTCTASVADLEACLTEQNEATAESFRVASCEDINDPPPDPDAEPVAPPACDKIASICPGLG